MINMHGETRYDESGRVDCVGSVSGIMVEDKYLASVAMGTAIVIT